MNPVPAVERILMIGDYHRLDHLLVESTGISEPLPVAAAFVFEDEPGEALRAHDAGVIAPTWLRPFFVPSHPLLGKHMTHARPRATILGEQVARHGVYAVGRKDGRAD